MTDISHLSSNAQGLVHALQHAAETSVAIRGYGYAQVHEDAVGGVDLIEGAIAELRGEGITVAYSGGAYPRYISLLHQGGSPVRLQRQK